MNNNNNSNSNNDDSNNNNNNNNNHLTYLIPVDNVFYIILVGILH